MTAIPRPLSACGVLLILSVAAAAAAERTLTVSVVDEQSQEPLAARLHLTAADGTPRYFESTAPEGTAVRYQKQNWINHDSIEYHTTVSAHPCRSALVPGSYRLIVEKGKHYFPVIRDVNIGDQDVTVTVPLRRWIDPESRGWYSGDTHTHRTIDELRNVLLAEDLNVAFPLTSWVTVAETPPSSGDKNLSGEIPIGLVKVDGTHVIWPRNTEYEIFTVNKQRHTLGALFVLGHLGSLERTVPPWRPVVESARRENPRVMFDMDKLDWPFAMLLPVVAPDSLYELTNNHLWRTEFAFVNWNTRAPAFMRPPFGAAHGGERQWLDYTLGMYYTLLNCGFRLPPTAGTANGVHPVPAGFGRVYVHLPDGFDFDRWTSGLQSGRSFVTTGPMLFATAADYDPGHTFESLEAKEIPLEIEVVSETPLTFGEIVVNGRPEHLLRPRNQPTDQGAFRSVIKHSLKLDRSGWFAVRFFEERDGLRTRFAHTAPWFVSMAGQPIQPGSEERRYLVERMRQEIDRSRGIVGDEGLAEYRQALAFYESLPIRDDADEVRRTARPLTEENRDQWLRNMVVDHRFSPEEVRSATGLTLAEAEAAATRILTTAADPPTVPATVKVLPYPGGRHPRRGFLDGALYPQRETKVSLFPPWKDGGYVVVDVPEAIFSNLGLTYLAHTHIPTVWSQQGIDLPPLEWHETDGALTCERTLPNGIRFTSRVTPQDNGAAMTLTLTNGTPHPLTGLRVQVCTMLSAADGFTSQMNLPKIVEEPFIAVRSETGNRWIITAWTPNNRVWSNPPVPCIHSDPIFPDCPPGETVAVTGGLWFYEGDGIRDVLRQLWERLK